MIFLRHNVPSRKRQASNSFISSHPQQPKIPKHQKLQVDAATPPLPPPPPPQLLSAAQINPIDKMVSVLADAGCTLINSSGPPCLPSDPHKLRHHLHHLFSTSTDPSLRSDFLSGFTSYIDFPDNLRRVLLQSFRDGSGSVRSESLVRVLLLVPSLQLDLQNMLLEKLPEYFDADPIGGLGSSSILQLDDDVARLILNQFRWLDFLVDSEAFTGKLLEVLSICPLHLKKEIIGSLPEIIDDQNNKTVVDSLERMLQNDVNDIIVPVLDSISNLNLDDVLLEKVTSLALSYLRTIDAEHMPYLLKFLLLSATPMNAGRIISKIREQLKNLGVSNISMTQQNKKGKSVLDNVDASILDALRSSLRYKNIVCQEILKELKSLDKAKDHKVIDIWLLMLIYMNGKCTQKSVEKIFKKKVIDGCIQEVMLDQCICGNKTLVRDFFASFLSLSEYLLASKEPKAREFGIHMYKCLFEEFVDTYSRQEVLGAIVTHVGSGSSCEVDSALEAMNMLASKYSQELLPLSSHISGILDYLEGFSIQSLHKVYEVFCILALSARSSAETFGSYIANELLMVVRKQVNNPDLKYKKRGLIGTLKIVSYLGDANNTLHSSSSQKSNNEEALELLKTSLDSCKQLPLPSVLFYDELIAMLNRKALHPEIFEWIGKHAGEFESIFLSDLVFGKLSAKDSYCGLEGELWMNLDGVISPICLNILPLVSSSMRSSSLLQNLPAHFLLLSTVERLANQGSLGGIDALLGCPIHLPSSKFFSGSAWQSLTDKQKQILCLSLYYAANWMRELLNAFSTQITGDLNCISQATKKEIMAKLLKRLRNLVYLESLLNNSLKHYPLPLPELYSHVEPPSSIPVLNHPNNKVPIEKKTDHMTANHHSGKNRRNSKASKNIDINRKSRQPTILDVLRKAGAIPSQDVPNDDSSRMSCKDTTFESTGTCSNSIDPVYIEVGAAAKPLEAQGYKFRPLLIDCFSILSLSQNLDKCCADPAAELPLHLYLLRDLHHKLYYFSSSSKYIPARCSNTSPGFSGMTVIEFLNKIRSIFRSLKSQLDCAVCLLKEGAESCQEHWKVQSALAGNPDMVNMVVSKISVSGSVFKETLQFLSKILNLPDVQIEKSVLSELLESFQPIKVPDDIFSGLQLIPSSGTMEFLYLGAYSFLEGILDVATTFSFTLAAELLLTLESVVTSAQNFLHKSLDGYCTGIHAEITRGLLSTLRSRLQTTSQKLLRHNWNSERNENYWMKKGDLVQKTVHIYLEYGDSTSDLLDELARDILPKVTSCRTTEEDSSHGFPTLCSRTFLIWYKQLHEENLAILNKLVKEVLEVNPRASLNEEVERLLSKLRQSINVVVSLINLCRTHDKETVHAMGIKYGGKFVDSFLKVFDFLQTQFEKHNELILDLVKELQKATRTIQMLCSEAKSLKQTVITRKIPSTKRSLERFLFQVKALLHTTSSGSTFWMGNLKHKDLMGQVVSSQLYMEDQDEKEYEPGEILLEEPAGVASDEERELE